MNLLLNLLEVNTKVTLDGGAAAPAADAAADGAVQASGGLMGNPLSVILIYCVVIFGALYFFSIRPQKKREASFEKMRSSIKVGDSVLLANGMYGRVVDVTAECFIVELGINKGIRIPVVKQEVAAIREPNLTNKPIEVEEPVKQKKGLFGFGKKESEDKSEQ